MMQPKRILTDAEIEKLVSDIREIEGGFAFRTSEDVTRWNDLLKAGAHAQVIEELEQDANTNLGAGNAGRAEAAFEIVDRLWACLYTGSPSSASGSPSAL